MSNHNWLWSVLLVLVCGFGTSGALAYERVAENDQLILYVQADSLAIRVEHKETGYLWSSIIEDLVPRENNVSWSNFMSSGLALEYFEENRTRVIRTDLLSAQEVEIELNPLEHGFSAQVNFGQLGISFQLDVYLEDNHLVVAVPRHSLRERGGSRLGALYLYPFLGATRQDQIPGYLFVPDGIGALIEFVYNQNKFNTPYEERFFGRNEGLPTASNPVNVRPPYTIKAPVFGIYHEPAVFGPQGVFAIVEEGQYNARLLAYPNGVVTQYNWITTKFVLREAYSQPTSRGMGGGVMVIETRANPENVQVRYIFTHGEQANYVGMAQSYQAYLEQQGILERNMAKREQIPLRLDLLGAETENGLLWKNLLPMTTTAQTQVMLGELQDLTEAELFVIFQGWNQGGKSGTSPYKISFERRLGGAQGFEDLLSFAERSQIKLYFYADYTQGYKEATRFSVRRDGAQRLNKTLLEKPTGKEVYPYLYLLTPQRAVELMAEDVRLYAGTGMTRVAVDHTPELLFSHARGGAVTARVESAHLYQQGLALLREGLTSVALHNPNVYLWGLSDAYLDLPLYSSQYAFFGRTVPFLPLVLRGYLDYFAPYTNFFANQEEELLRLVEYGAYPSYYLTWEPAYKLKHSNSNQVFTSTYADWREVIRKQYALLNEVLGQVEGATIFGHTQLTPEVVAVEYSNGKLIVVNYSTQDYESAKMVVPGRGVVVQEVQEP